MSLGSWSGGNVVNGRPAMLFGVSTDIMSPSVIILLRLASVVTSISIVTTVIWLSIMLIS